MTNVDDFDRFGTHSIHDAVRALYQFADIGLAVTFDHATQMWKLSQTITAFQDGIDRSVSSVLRIGCDVGVDIGKRS